MKQRTWMLAAMAAAATLTTQAGLVALWDLEEGSGTTTTEQVGGTVSGALPGGTTWVDGGATGSSGALSFTGQGPVVTGVTGGDIGIAGSGAKTLVAWINTTMTSQGAFLGFSPTAGQGAGADLRFLINGNNGDTTGKLRMEVSSGGFEFGSGFNDGNWHFVAFVIHANDGINDVDVYVNGDYTARSGGGTLINTTADGNERSFYLGSDGNAGRNYTGLLDDVAIFDAALTEAELDTLYTQGIPEPATMGLVVLFGGGIMLVRRKLML